MPPTGAKLATQRRQQSSKPIKHHTRPSFTPFPKTPVEGEGGMGAKEMLKDPTLVGSAPGPKPTSGPLAIATEPEWAIYWALLKLGKKPDVDFQYRGNVPYFGGRSQRTQLDFTILDGSNIAIEVQGIYWHYGQGTAKQVLDRVRTSELAGFWTVIDIDEDDAEANPLYFVREALAGRDHSFRYKGFLRTPVEDRQQP